MEGGECRAAGAEKEEEREGDDVGKGHSRRGNKTKSLEL